MRTLRVDNFSLNDTLGCGQTFSWVIEGEGYVNADIGKVVYVEQHGDKLHYECSSGDADLKKLLRLDDPIEEIHAEIRRDELIGQSIDYASGLRLVSDPFYPCLVSFLISTWSNIPRIQKHMRDIREAYGQHYDFRGKMYYGLPTPDAMAKVKTEDLKKLGLAWRADFITKSTKALLDREVSEKDLKDMKYEDAHKTLQSMHGVGAKVADCVCLFSLGFLEAFPIDVWIERVIDKYYGIFTDVGKSYTKKSRAAREYFGQYAGYAQEYLYHYSRCTF
ncbi:MAG: DNA glycosylase [Candidatus Thorarchaeota archaeon]